MEYMNISQYCLNLIKAALKQFFETKYQEIIKEEYNLSTDSFFDVMFYFAALKNNINQIKELPKVIINTIHSLKIFRNKIAHQVPISLREFYRFVDDTQIIIESLNICNKTEIIKIENTRKEIIKRMNVSDDDNKIIIGVNFVNEKNDNNLNLQKYNKFSSDSDIEMGDYDDNFTTTNNNNIINNNYNNYNNFEQFDSQNNINQNNNINSEERERKNKIDKNYEEIMKNNDKDNFLSAKKVEFK